MIVNDINKKSHTENYIFLLDDEQHLRIVEFGMKRRERWQGKIRWGEIYQEVILHIDEELKFSYLQFF